jgi:hypothetical protein
MSTTLKVHNGDLLLDTAGRFATCQGIEKCSQDIAETLLNNYDPQNPSHYIGSEFYKLDRMTFSAGGLDAITMIETFARDAIKRLMEMQENDTEVDDDELIAKIEYLQVRRIGGLSYAFFLKCVTDSDLPAEIKFDISLQQQFPSSIARPPGGFAPGTGSIL